MIHLQTCTYCFMGPSSDSNTFLVLVRNKTQQGDHTPLLSLSAARTVLCVWRLVLGGDLWLVTLLKFGDVSDFFFSRRRKNLSGFREVVSRVSKGNCWTFPYLLIWFDLIWNCVQGISIGLVCVNPPVSSYSECVRVYNCSVTSPTVSTTTTTMGRLGMNPTLKSLQVKHAGQLEHKI